MPARFFIVVAIAVIAVAVGPTPAWGAGTTARELVEEGEAALRAGDVPGAFRAYSRAISADPKHAAAYLGRGQCRVRLNDPTGGESDFTQALKLDPALKDAYVCRGQSRLARGEHALAIADFDEALARDETHAAVYADRGWARWLAHDVQGARADLDRALALDPALVSALLRRTTLKWKTGDVFGAFTDASRASQLDPKNTQAIFERATIGAELGMSAAAIEEFTRVLALDPKRIDALIGRGDAYRRQGKFKEAMADLDQALQLAPRSSAAYAGRGRIKFEANDRPGAVEDYVRAKELDAKNADALVGIAQLLQTAGLAQESIRELDAAIALDPYHGMAFVTRAFAKIDVRDYDGAFSDIEQALQLKPGDAKANLINARGDVRVRQGDFTSALADYRAALSMSPPSEFARSGMMVAAFASGNFDRAERVCDELVNKDTTHPTPHLYRGLLFRHRGNLQRAIAEFEIAANAGSTRALHWYYIASVENGADAMIRKVFYRTVETWKQHGIPQWEWVLGDLLLGNLEEKQALLLAPGSGDSNRREFQTAQREARTMEAYRLHLAGANEEAIAKLRTAAEADDRVELERFIHLRDITRWSETAASPGSRQ